MAASTALPQGDATLLMLHALRRVRDPVDRILAEGVASISRAPACQAVTSRVLDVFRTRVWRRRLYEAVAHLETNRCITPTPEGYFITQRGEERIQGIAHSEAELADIQRVGATVSHMLGV